MRLISKFLLAGLFVLNLNAQEEPVNINFKDLKVMDLIKITSKIIDKNILITEEIKGNVDFVSNKPINKDELVKIYPYYDFMTENSITVNDDNYIDTSHLKQEFGYLYFAKVFEDSSVNVPKDFGILIK